MKLHEKIRLLRKSKGVSQTFIAEKIDMTTSGYSMKESGKRPITTNELEIIAKALEVPATVFFEEEFHVKLNKKSLA
ncbi:helix-turn-helix domain-containing protein [Priestia filamentosa]|uniref:helix-turn-helix domain-containing protein n=1 Tax=Priestia filamentosa TaxID=1402861 RepID=UPI000A087F2E|nr:helix-turn-helix transcriptional regulator [Priestia filamentosa]MDT3763010.1 helix-turn-helix transcriptional regulator [Priestia filamentosa]OXS69528.1 transcriptional regulator [Priestia filamentosa]WRU97448.1 helix-turn-helix transcriptional regulator [Priestia filamentosa]SMF33642.1 Helix-turn-helix [Priestia filamentosa]